MRTFTQKPQASPQTSAVNSTLAARTHVNQRHAVTPNLNPQTTFGNHAAQERLQPDPSRLDGNPNTQAASPFAFDFSQIPVHARTPGQGTVAAQTQAADKRRPGANPADVRIHTDEHAATAAEALGAAAYTKGNDIFFGAGRYQPELPSGRRLLLHEMAHVIQQQNPGQPAASDALEREADRAAANAIAGREARIQLSASQDRAQCQPMSWKTGDVIVDPVAANQIKTQGGLFSGNDQAHINVSAKGKLAYDASYTTPEDSFRWSRLKEIVDNGHVQIFAVSDKQVFQTKPTPTAPLLPTSLSQIKGAAGITLIVGELSPDPVYNQVYYDQAKGIGALTHELFGHVWLALKKAPHVHPPAGSPTVATVGTILPAHKITDPFGNIFSGTVSSYIAKNIESLGTKQAVTTSAGQQINVPKSPTQQVGQGPVVKAVNDLYTQASGGLTKSAYSAPVAQTWRIICNNYDLMPTNAEAIKAGNSNLLFTKEPFLLLCYFLFMSWKADQKSGFRIMLADFNASRGGFTVNELSTKLEQAVGAAPSPFNQPSGLNTPGVSGLQLSNPTGGSKP